jgi:hypothetical protein
MPPMPWETYRNMTDADVKAVYAYLRTLKPVKNRVPDWVEPTGPPAAPPPGK